MRFAHFVPPCQRCPPQPAAQLYVRPLSTPQLQPLHRQIVSHRTLVQSSFEAYLAGEGLGTEAASREERDRKAYVQRFPHFTMLQLAYPELDFAERWCWQTIGPKDGPCLQRDSEYRVCWDETDHAHAGKWTSHWYAKTEYNFGYCEFYFSDPRDHEAFVESLPEFTWGEGYPK